MYLVPSIPQDDSPEFNVVEKLFVYLQEISPEGSMIVEVQNSQEASFMKFLTSPIFQLLAISLDGRIQSEYPAYVRFWHAIIRLRQVSLEKTGVNSREMLLNQRPAFVLSPWLRQSFVHKNFLTKSRSEWSASFHYRVHLRP